MNTESPKETPKIYVACLEAYNKGILHGDWIDATQSLEAIKNQISAVLATSPMPGAEETGIHDYEGFGEIDIKEYTDLSTIKAMADIIVEHGEAALTVLKEFAIDIDSAKKYLDLIIEYGDAAIAIFVYESYVDTAKQYLEDYYQGCFSSQMEFAEQLFDELYGSLIPESVTYFIDYDLFCKQLFTYDYFSVELKGVLHIFACGSRGKNTQPIKTRRSKISRSAT